MNSDDMLKRIFKNRVEYENRYKDNMNKLLNIVNKAINVGDITLVLPQIKSLSNSNTMTVFEIRALSLMCGDIDRLGRWRRINLHIEELISSYNVEAIRLFQNINATKKQGTDFMDNVYYFYSCAFVYDRYKKLLTKYKEIQPEQLPRIKDDISKELNMKMKSLDICNNGYRVVDNNYMEFINTFSQNTIVKLNKYIDDAMRVALCLDAYNNISLLYDMNSSKKFKLNINSWNNLSKNISADIDNKLAILKENANTDLVTTYMIICCYYKDIVQIRLMKQIKDNKGV